MLNRFMLFLFSVFLLAISTIFVLISAGWTTPLNFLNMLYSDLPLRVTFGAVGGFILILGLYIFLLSLFKKPLQHTNVEKTALGEINISLKAVENLLQQAALTIKGIREIKPIIRSTEQGVYLYIKAIIGPEVHIPLASKELQNIAKDVLENSAGIKVLEVRVTVVDVNQDAKVRVH